MITDADLAILIPLWRRTSHIERVWRSARAATPNAKIVFIGSIEDHAVQDALTALLTFPTSEHDGQTWVNVPANPPEVVWLDGPGGGRGDYSAKVNAGYEHTTEPLLFTGADDLHFHPGWFEPAAALIDVPREVVETFYGGARHGGGTLIGPDRIPTIGVVGTVDDCNARTVRGTHSTHSLVARWYADQGGMVDQDHVIYNEDYWHEWCDDELVGTAMARHAYAHSFDSMVEHLHWLVDKSPMDETYERGKARSRESRAIFRRRRVLWGGRNTIQARRIERG